MNAPTTPQVMDPATLDRRIRELAFVTADRNLTELAARWNDFTTSNSRAGVDAVLQVAKHWVRCRVDELLDHDVTADGIIGIASICQHRTGLHPPARVGKLIAEAYQLTKHDQMDAIDSQRLPWVIAAIGAPEDLEPVRTPFLYHWLRASTRPSFGDNRDTIVHAVLDGLARSAPPDWTEITGTLCAAAGVARANLRVRRPDGAVGLSAAIHMPELHRLRRIDQAAGTPWWRAEIHLTPTSRHLTPTHADEELPPMDLMRPSEYLAESQFTGRPLPAWLQTFCDLRIVANTTTLSPGAATEKALITLATNGIDVDPRRVTIQHANDGYLVRAQTESGPHTVQVDNSGRARTTKEH